MKPDLLNIRSRLALYLDQEHKGNTQNLVCAADIHAMFDYVESLQSEIARLKMALAEAKAATKRRERDIRHLEARLFEKEVKIDELTKKTSG